MGGDENISFFLFLFIPFKMACQLKYLQSGPNRTRCTRCDFKTSCINRTPLQEAGPCQENLRMFKTGA